MISFFRGKRELSSDDNTRAIPLIEVRKIYMKTYFTRREKTHPSTTGILVKMNVLETFLKFFSLKVFDSCQLERAFY